MQKKSKTKNPIQPISGTKVPRFAGPSTFARLPEMRDVKSGDELLIFNANDEDEDDDDGILIVRK